METKIRFFYAKSILENLIFTFQNRLFFINNLQRLIGQRSDPKIIAKFINFI